MPTTFPEHPQNLSTYRLAPLTMPCPSHKDFNIKLKHFANMVAAGNATANAATGGAIALPIHLQ